MDHLSDLDHIRRRPGMYIGSTGQTGIQHLVFEVVDNAVDQFLANKATCIVVRIVGRTIHIDDNGEGYPFDYLDVDGVSLGVKYLTRIHNSNTVDNHTPHIHANGFGCGLFALNALTQRLVVTAVRSGTLFRQSYSRGVLVSSTQEPDASGALGTAVEFELDEMIFGNQMVDIEQIRIKLRRLSFLFPGLAVHFQEEKFHSTKGLVDLLRTEMGIESQPVFSICLQLGGTIVAAAAAGNTDQRTEIASFANAAPTIENSSHVKGLKRALRRAKWKPAGAAISVILSDPSFAGPTRQVLHMPGLEKPISDLLAVAIKQFRSEV